MGLFKLINNIFFWLSILQFWISNNTYKLKFFHRYLEQSRIITSIDNRISNNEIIEYINCMVFLNSFNIMRACWKFGNLKKLVCILFILYCKVERLLRLKNANWILCSYIIKLSFRCYEKQLYIKVFDRGSPLLQSAAEKPSLSQSLWGKHRRGINCFCQCTYPPMGNGDRAIICKHHSNSNAWCL